MTNKIYLLPLLSAVLMFAAVQVPVLWWLSFAALGPFVYALVRNGLQTKPLKERIIGGGCMGLIYGFVYYSLCFCWLWKVVPGLNLAAGLWEGLFPALLGLLSPFFTRRFSACLFGLPCLWIACEYVRSLGFLGSAMYSAAELQAPNLPLLQYVSFFGHRFLDFAVVFAVCAIVLLMIDKSKMHRLQALLAVILFAAVQMSGALLIMPLKAADYRVKLVQPNMNLFTKTDSGAFEKDLMLTNESGDADLVIWPETVLSQLNYPDNVRLAALARKIDTPLIAGANIPTGDFFTNSAILYTAKGKRAGQYNKCRLVPFGEYMPFERNAYMAHFRMIPLQYKAGRSRQMPLVTGLYKIGMSICYDSVFPECSLESVRAGANVLAAICNDGWVQNSNVPYALLQSARLRAVENRRWFLRCSSTGLSAVVSPYGHVTSHAAQNEETVLMSYFGLENTRTIFSRTGDVLTPLCCFVMLGFVIAGINRERIPID